METYLVANAIVLPTTGWISSVVGRKRFFLTCIALFTASSVLCGLAPTLPFLLLARVLQGAAGGGLQPMAQAIMADVFPSGEARPGVCAVWTYGCDAPALGPTLGGWITDSYSWRWIFWINVPVGLLALALVFQMVEDPPFLTRKTLAESKFDYIGFSALALGVAALQIVLDKGQEDDWLGSPFIATLCVVSIVGLGFMVLWEWFEKEPIVEVRLFKVLNFTTSSLMMFVVGVVSFSSIILMPQYLQNLMGYTAEKAGLVVSAGAAVLLLVMPLVGFLTSKMALKYLMAFGWLLSAVGLYISTNLLSQSGTQRSQALSQLLPQISLEAMATERQINLAAYGLSSLSGAGASLSSSSLPDIIGPFHYVQGQANLNWQNVSVTNYRDLQVARQVDTAAKLSLRDAREMVILAVGGTYMQIAAAAARVDAQALQVKYAEATYDQAKTRLEAGTNTRIDMTRSLVQLQTEQERLISLQSDLEQQEIAFTRMIGVPQSSTLVLSDPLGVAGVTPPEVDAELKLAQANRQDLKAAEAQVRAGQEAASGAHAERVPSFSFTGYYGPNGPTPTQSHGVFAATGTINVPIFDGGKIRADVDQAESTLRQRKAEYADMQGQVEQQVRNALVKLRAAIGQVKLAQSNREYALETLQQAQDRFEAGVTTTVEVVQAQQGEGSAENDYINGLFAYDLARLSLARATGQAETDFNSILGGSHP